MPRSAFGLAVLLLAALPEAALGQAGSTAASASARAAAPMYRVSFARGDAVSGISATPAIKLPFQCTSDGTIFVGFVGTVPANSGLPPPPPGLPPTLLTSISPAGRGQTFRLDQVPELYISSEEDHFASDSDVTFLVRASRENKPAKQAYTVGSYHVESTGNTAEQHLYIVRFSRDGEYRRTIEIGDAFRILQIAVFPSGTFLASGYDAKDHSPKLAMLKEDGALLKFLEIPKGGAPESVVSAADARRAHAIAPTELVPEGRAILVVQKETAFPLLEVNEGGAVRAIQPKLPSGEQIEAAIPADQNLYVIAGQETGTGRSEEIIYEVSQGDGTVLRRLALSDGRTASDIACVHDGKFLSMDYRDGKVVPLIGSAEAATSTDQQKGGQSQR
jgi:hypothetical protein